MIYDLPFGHGRHVAERCPAPRRSRARRLAAVARRLPAERELPDADHLGPRSDRDPVHDGGHPPDRDAPPRSAARSHSSSDPTIDRWFDVAAFGAPPIGRFGTAARGSIESPGLNLWHFGLHKRFRFGDRPGSPTFRIEVTSTNIFNHPQWAASEHERDADQRHRRPRSAPSAAAAGAIQQAGMRAIRLGARLDW